MYSVGLFLSQKCVLQTTKKNKNSSRIRAMEQVLAAIVVQEPLNTIEGNLR
jgi:hypothetical protein